MSAFDGAFESALAAQQDRMTQEAAERARREAERRELFQQYIAPIYRDARDALLRREFPLHRGLEPQAGSDPRPVRGWPLDKWFLDESGNMRGIRVGTDWKGFSEGKPVVFSVTAPTDVYYREGVHIVDGAPWRRSTTNSDAVSDNPVEWEIRQLLLRCIPTLEQNARSSADRGRQPDPWSDRR